MRRKQAAANIAASRQWAERLSKTIRGERQVSPFFSKFARSLSKKSWIFAGVFSFCKSFNSALVNPNIVVL